MNIIRLFTAASHGRRRRSGHSAAAAATAARGHLSVAEALSGRFANMVLFLGGGEKAEASRIPASEVVSLRVDGTILLLSMTINAAIWFSALLYAEAPMWAAGLIALLAALLIGLFDRQILSSLLNVEGEDLMKSQRLPGFYPVDKRKRWILTGGRIVLSVASMFAVSMLVRVAIFAPDIEAHLAKENRAQNHAVRVAAERIVDGEIADARGAYVQAVKERNHLQETVGRTDLPPDTQAIDAELETLRAGMQTAISDYRRAYTQYREYSRAEAAERAGAKERETDSGIPGEGARHSYAREMMGRSATEAQHARSTYATAAKRLQQLQVGRDRYVNVKGQQAAQSRNLLSPRVAEAEKRMAELNARRERVETSRPAAVRKLLEADPAYVEKRAGLMARVNALSKVEHGSDAAWLLSIAITAVCSILEMAVIWARAVLGVPNPAGAVRVLANQQALDQAIRERRDAKSALRKSRPPSASNDTGRPDREQEVKSG